MGKKDEFREVILSKGIADSLEGDLKDSADIEALMQKANLSPEAQKAVMAAMKILAPYKDELGEEYMTLESLKKGGEDKVEKVDEKKGELKKEDLAPEVQAFIKKTEDAMEGLKKEGEKIAKEKADLEKTVTEERDLRLKKEFLAKAEAMPFIPGEKEKLADFLKGLDEKQNEFISGLLAGANAQLSKSDLFKEIGSMNHESRDAVGNIEKMAEAMILKGDGKMSKEQAISKVLEAHPELYAEYDKAQMAKK